METNREQELQKKLSDLIDRVGEPGSCRGCNRKIYWVRHRTGKSAPYDHDGTSHFVTCPHADRFRKPGP